ncbi:MAG: hypothetical protein QM754_07825 [Tepidisphaeraceae bacterium]
MASTHEDIPAHPIIDKPWQFEIVRFDFHRDPGDRRSSYLDLWLRRGEELRKLRFLQPRSIQIEEGFPSRTNGMAILDVSSLGWEDVAVQVTDFEASNGAVTFYAKDVVEVT